jgi:hypothetical protein
MICPEKRCIFVHIQKTGGDSVRSILGGDRKDKHKHRTAVELRAVYGHSAWRDCYTFAFVRNPWDRLVSWWSMIGVVRSMYRMGDTLNAFQRYVLDNANNFEEFLTRCGEEISDSDGRKGIFRNQIEYLCDENGEVIVDFIGRYGRLQLDMDYVANRIGLDRFILPHLNRSQHKRYPEYYTSELVELVSERFRKDLDAFGYRFGD